MWQLMKMFLDLAFLRIGPQDVPDAPWLLKSVLLLNVAVSLLIMGREIPLVEGFIRVALGIAVMWILVRGLLNFKGLQSRFRQTFIALMAADIVITLAQLALIILGFMPEVPAKASQIEAIVWTLIVFWALSVQGNILHHALNVSRIMGALLAFSLMLITVVVSFTLYPPDLPLVEQKLTS